MTTLLHSDARNVLNLLLLHLSTHRVRVLAGVKIVAGIKRTVSIESEQHIVRIKYVCSAFTLYLSNGSFFL